MSKIFWHACELHCHTRHSDGEFTLPNLVKTSKDRMLEGICLTDHNTQSGWLEAENIDFPILKGIEWTTYFGHMLVLDCKKQVDWRNAQIGTIDESTKEVKENGGLVGIAHPFQLGTPICTGGHWDFDVNHWENVDYVEIWSAGKPFLNGPNSDAIKMWHSILDKGYHVSPTFGRDWHKTKGDIFPSACTYLGTEETELSAEQMKESITKGRTSVSVGPLFFVETDEGTIGDTLTEGEKEVRFVVDIKRLKKVCDRNIIKPKKIRVVTNNEETVLNLDVDGKLSTAKILLRRGHWYSAELWGQENAKEHTLLAVTAPIYIRK